MSPAMSGKPQALAPGDVHHVGLVAFAGLTPVPERSAVAATDAVQAPPFEASHMPHSVCACLSMMQRCRSDRKSTRLNSSHANISYAVFCLKKKKKET